MALNPQSLFHPATVIHDLLRRATRHEAPVVEGLAVAAGYFWRCGNKNCNHANPVNPYGTGDVCVKCYTDRA